MEYARQQKMSLKKYTWLIGVHLFTLVMRETETER